MGKEGIGEDAKERLKRLLQRELASQSGFSSLGTRVLNHSKTGTKFTIHEQVSPQLFHDVFEIVRHYTPNGELVDLHDDYSNCKCYLNEDGTCGFAIEPDGNLVSVFNLGLQKGFLTATAPYIMEQGATHLDAYNSDRQPLRTIYEKVFGAKVASSMDYNMEYDHDDIAKNHGNPQVVFMVMGKAAEKGVKERHFNKDQYDEAQGYQKSLVTERPSKAMTFEEKRDYYLTQYPTEFLAAKDRNPEIAKLGLMRKLTVKNGKIQFLRSGRLRQQTRDAFMRDMDALLYMGDEGLQMAQDLFMYAYYSEGFSFGPNNFGSFFSTNFIKCFPEVAAALLTALQYVCEVSPQIEIIAVR